jgi:hypothetical protein
MSRTSRKKAQPDTSLNLKRIGALLLIVVFVMAGVISITPQNTAQNFTPTEPPIGGVVFPTVPPGGVLIVADYTYFHSSGLISLPYIHDWDFAPQSAEQGPEQRVEPVGTPGTPGSTQSTLAGVTFINSKTLSVIHAYAERDPSRNTTNAETLNSYFNNEILNQAWVNFKSGWSELNRKTENDTVIINFELRLDDNVYLARMEQDWMMVLRLVVPNNNPLLLDQLQTAVWPQYRLWPQSLNSPISWTSVVDYALGYIVKYPPDWRKLDGVPGQPFTVSGVLGADTFTLITRAEPGKAVKTEDEARAYVKANWPNSTAQTVKTETHGDTSGFAVSYINPDSDGNQRSAVVTLLNGANGTLYVANLQSSGRGQDLLVDTQAPPDLARIRSSFFVVPTQNLLPTAIPTITPTPTMTIVGEQPLPTTIPTTVVPTVAPTIATTIAPTTAPTTAPSSIAPTTAPPSVAPTGTPTPTAPVF